jgi:lactate dehydrogenase-like 2-hydroxyacid dehydrogenase
MSEPRLLVTRRWPEAVERHLQENYDVQLNADDVPMTAEALQAAFRDYDAVLPTVSDRITAEVMGAEPLKARLVGNFGVGFNHIDIEAAKARGLTVTNTPDVLTDCTADIAMTLLLTVARRAGEGERHVRASEWTGWRPTHMMGTKVTDKTLGTTASACGSSTTMPIRRTRRRWPRSGRYPARRSRRFWSAPTSSPSICRAAPRTGT